jgi:hypothetical protein
MEAMGWVFFALVGSQYPLEVGGEDFYWICSPPLKLRASVVIELEDNRVPPGVRGEDEHLPVGGGTTCRGPRRTMPSIGMILQGEGRVMAETP